jgi:hypothetical protein
VEVHKPKPVHSWRELLTEIGVVVIGVCIALGAEQAVEWVHWRGQVAEARKSLATEMSLNVRSAVTRLRSYSCTEQRLDKLAKILDAASRAGNLPPVGIIGMPPRRQWSNGGWESVMASQVATHFPRQELTLWARAYGGVGTTRTLNGDEMKAWSDLNAMVGPGRRLDPASEADLRNAIGLARTDNRMLENIAYQTLILLNAINPPYSKADLEGISGALRESLASNKIAGASVCQPIGAVPAEYGQTALPSYGDRQDDGLKLLPGLQTLSAD